MKVIQPTLINFSAFRQLNLFSDEVVISESGIIHSKRVFCETCGTECLYNGPSNKGKHILSNSIDILFRKGQQYCPTCDKTIQVENAWLDKIITSLNHFIASQVLSLCENLSEDEIRTHLKNTMSLNVSKSTIHNIIYKSNKKFEEIDFNYEINQHFYGYDEQYLKIDGKQAYRLVFFDYKENKVIYEKIHYNFSKKTLKKVLKEVFGDFSPEGFVVDMRVQYPKAFREVFGRKIKVQFCVFHLNKLILKEYKDSLKVGKHTKWTLTHYYNMYTLFNIFYDRTFELKQLKKLMAHFENFKANLTTQKVMYYTNKYKIKSKPYEIRKSKVIEIMEKKLIKAFRKITHDKKNLRKRRKTNLSARDPESAKEVFEKVYEMIDIYPKKIRERIEKIKNNFEYFIASEGEILTNNRLEGFFGATLKKFRKKSCKSLMGFKALLKRKRAKSQGIQYYRKFNLYDIANIFSVLTLFS